jgi:hypothetical protein
MTVNHPGRSLAVVCVAAAVLLAGGVAGFAAAAPTHHAQPATTDDPVAVQGNQTNVTNATANLTFPNQTSNGTMVFVENVTLSEGGFVAIHNESLLQNETVGSVIGVSSYLEPGAHQNVSVTLFNVSGANYTQTSLDPGNHTLIAMLHMDTNGNQTYDFVATDGSEDGPYTFANGTAVTDQATVEVMGGNVTANATANETANATMNATNATNATAPVGR